MRQVAVLNNEDFNIIYHGDVMVLNITFQCQLRHSFFFFFLFQLRQSTLPATLVPLIPYTNKSLDYKYKEYQSYLSNSDHYFQEASSYI